MGEANDPKDPQESHPHGRSHGHAHGKDYDRSAGAHAHGVGVEEGFVEAVREPGTELPQLAEGAGAGKTLFLDMQSGIAGDMTIAALVDLGVPGSVFEEVAAALGLHDVQLEVKNGYAGAIGCTHLDVRFPPQSAERTYPQIRDLIEQSPLDPDTKKLSCAIFERLARAEATVHRTTLDHVHFHEVGAVDAIIDIVGAARGFVYLGAQVKASPVPLGRGFVQCRHGRLPLPAPATLNCLEGVPTVFSGLDSELVTPTGAAIVATVAKQFVDWVPLRTERVGWGAGTRGLPDRPNALRAILGEEVSMQPAATHVVLEANIDDMTGELAAHALSRVISVGAVDAWVTPVTMKKGRPGMIFSALASVEDAQGISEVILRETSTIGVRQTLVRRVELPRQMHTIETKWGPVRLKISAAGTSLETRKLEFSDVVLIAERSGRAVRQVLVELGARDLDPGPEEG